MGSMKDLFSLLSVYFLFITFFFLNIIPDMTKNKYMGAVTATGIPVSYLHPKIFEEFLQIYLQISATL